MGTGKPAGRKKGRRRREPLSSERVVATAMELADTEGLGAVSMRTVAQRLGVEAMSLYKHVANKDAILDGMTELVFAEMRLPPRNLGWKEGMRARAEGMRAALLAHRWAANLVESRATPTPGRLRHHDESLGLLRDAGFSVELAYNAILSLDSYIYGFVAQEVWWPFAPDERPELIETLSPAIRASSYPNVVEVMGFVMSRASASHSRGASSQKGYDADFAFGLELLLDGLERACRPERRRGARQRQGTI